MNSEATYEVIEGIKCYHPNVCREYVDYPEEGVDLTESVETSSFWVSARHRLLAWALRRYRNPAGDTVFFELGSAGGAFLKYMRGTPGFAFIGSEVYLQGLIHARRKLPEVEFLQLDAASATPAFRERFDQVGAFDVLEHIEDDRQVMANVREMLKPEGYFIITVPQHPFLWSSLDNLVKHKRRYTRRELVGKLREAGFSVPRVTSYFFTLFPLIVATRLKDRLRPQPNADLAAWVQFPRWVNWLFDKCMYIDEALIKMGISLPCGGTLVAVARKG